MRFASTALLLSVAASSASAAAISSRQQASNSTAPDVPMCTNVDPACDFYDGISICVPSCYKIVGSSADTATADANSAVNSAGQFDDGGMYGGNGMDGTSGDSTDSNQVGNTVGDSTPAGQTDSNGNVIGQNNYDGAIYGQGNVNNSVNDSVNSQAHGKCKGNNNSNCSRELKKRQSETITCDFATLKCTDGKVLTGCRKDYSMSTNITVNLSDQCGLPQGDGRNTGAAAPRGAAALASSSASSAPSSTSRPSSSSSAAPSASRSPINSTSTSGAMDLQPRMGAALLAGLVFVGSALVF